MFFPLSGISKFRFFLWFSMLWFGHFQSLRMISFFQAYQWQWNTWKIWVSSWIGNGILIVMWVTLVLSWYSLRILLCTWANSGVRYIGLLWMSFEVLFRVWWSLLLALVRKALVVILFWWLLAYSYFMVVFIPLVFEWLYFLLVFCFFFLSLR